MKNRLKITPAIVLLAAILLLSWDNPHHIAAAGSVDQIPHAIIPVQSQEHDLADKIEANQLFDSVYLRGTKILKTGFNAGSHYEEAWIRDLNTFIKHSLKVLPQKEVRDALLWFFYFQGFDGNMVDGYQEITPGMNIDSYARFIRYDVPGYAFHKNTVETDQESSLVQSVYKYIQVSGDKAFLNEIINGKTIHDRLEFALEFVMNFRFNKDYGLVWGPATADWGDVQFLHSWGVKHDEYSDPSIDIYDNAMFLIALENFIKLSSDRATISKWQEIHNTISANVRKYLWDKENQKFVPHIYLKSDPFKSVAFDESEVFYHGGTAVAIEAGLLSGKEIKSTLMQMKDNVEKSGAQSIGLTVYPPYPDGFFANRSMIKYGYQNGGDWTWFGGRMITQLVKYGFVEEAYEEMLPFIERVIDNNGFFEWYTIDGKPNGAGLFKGSAGVLLEAIDEFRAWAETH